MMKGFIGFSTAKDLFDKLKIDYEEFCKDPKNRYKAFNFIVTAEHLPDWIENIDIKHQDPYLRINSHLATGAKHFEVTNKKKQSVEGYSVDVYVQEGYVEDGYIETVLVIDLTEDEAKTIGSEIIELEQLVQKVFGFWEEYFLDGVKT